MADCRGFHLFPELPPEIRALIWQFTVQPRIVPISCWVGCRSAGRFGFVPHVGKWDKTVADYRSYVLTATPIRTELPLELYAVTPLPPPAILTVCKEARGLGLYEKMILTPGSSASFAWVNYDVDIIDIPEEYSLLRHCGSRIRRLRTKVDLTDEGWSRGCAHALGTFTQLAECFIVMKGDARIWYWRTPDNYSLIPCALGRIHFIDERINERITCAELIRMTQEEIMAWVKRVNELGEDVFDSDDSD